MSEIQQQIPYSIKNYKGNNSNIPKADQLKNYFKKINYVDDLLRLHIILNYITIDGYPIKNMFKFLFVPLDPNSKISGHKTKILTEPKYISVDCDIDYDKMEKEATLYRYNPRKLMLHQFIYFKPVKYLNDIEIVENFEKDVKNTKSNVGMFLLSELNVTYSLYYFKNNISIETDASGNMNAQICYKYFQDEKLQDIIETIDNESYTCSAIELNAPFIKTLPFISKNINLSYLDDSTLVSFIYKNSEDIDIHLPPTPIEVSAIEDNPINYCPNASIDCNQVYERHTDDDDASNKKRKLPFAEEPANMLYETSNPNRGLVFTNKDELVVPDVNNRRIVRATKRLRTPYGGKKQNKLKKSKTRKVKKTKKYTSKY